MLTSKKHRPVKSTLLATLYFVTLLIADSCLAVDWSSVKIGYDDYFKKNYEIVDKEILDENTVEWTVIDKAARNGFNNPFLDIVGVKASFENKKGVSLGEVMLQKTGSGPRYSFTLNVPSEISEQWGRISIVIIK